MSNAPVILIPAYEPDEKLIDLVLSLRSADPDLTVVIVDDGSGPAYQRIFDTAEKLGCAVGGYDHNRGKGYALKSGFAFIAEQYPGRPVVCADSDGQHRVPDILRVADRVRASSAAMVLGVREFTGQVPVRSRMGNAVTRWLFRLATGRTVQDTQTGLRGYPAPLLGWLQSVDGERYEYELNLLLAASRQHLDVDTVPIATIYLNENRSSHFRPFADSARIYAPLLRFLVSSLTAFAVDAGALVVLDSLTGSLLVSVIGARVISSAVNFAVNRTVVFDRARERPVAAAATKYFGLVVVLLGLNYGLLSALTATGLPLLPAKLLTELALVLISYPVQRHLIFAGRGRRLPNATSPITKDNSHALTP